MFKPHQMIVLAVGLLLAQAVTVRAAEPTAEQIKFFEMHVRPVLVQHCYKCHSDEKETAGLRLDSLGAMLAGGDSGPAIVPGNPEESYLIEAINYESWEMPPAGKLGEKEINALTEWVRMGAPWPDAQPIAAVKKERITDEDRAFWSFQPVVRPAVPELENDNWSRNAIDRFVLHKLRAEELAPADEADRMTLIRRAYFDLIGLPPTPEEVDAFLADSSDDAYEKMIDRLLDSPRYGEHWARYWLDLVRYAESDGFRADHYRPDAWRYRDYVVRALNEDKPYDQFVMEQLAGDEIAPDDADALVATGLMRLGIYEYNQRDARTQWQDMVNDVTDVAGDAFLALGMGCARCHDHKFDPILQKDYFRLQAFFTPMYPRNDVPAADAQTRKEYEEQLAAWEAKTKDLLDEIDKIKQPVLESRARGSINMFPEDIKAIMDKPEAEWTPLEKQLAWLIQQQVLLAQNHLPIKGEQKERLDALTQKLAPHLRDKPQPLPSARTISDVGPEAPPTLIPGARNPEPIEPGFPTVIVGPDPAQIETVPTAPNSTGRRTALARWITDPANPLTARVMVNRIWQSHFGYGIVGTTSDFGTMGERPTHPELLDWLASEFVERGWSIKEMHRLMVTSATYRQAALRPTPEVAKLKDPENRWLWRMNPRRLRAEQIRDAALAAAGVLDMTIGGPSVSANHPRRSIYTRAIRNTRDPLLDAFDLPGGFTSTPERNVTTTATQALLMINGEWVLTRAQALAKKLQQHPTLEERIDAAYRLVYSRTPNSIEREAAAIFLREQAGRVAPDASGAESGLVEAMPHRDTRAAVVRDSVKAPSLRVPNNPSLPTGDFTVEAYVLLESLFKDASVRTIASQWSGRNEDPGWSLGVTSEKSAYSPRNLILQLVGDPKKGAAGYEVIPSGLRLHLNRPYYVAVSVQIAETGVKGITFYLKDLSDNDAPIQSVQIEHRNTGHYSSKSDFVIGARDGQYASGWDGLISDVRLTAAALTLDDLMISGVSTPEKLVGFWRFGQGSEFVKDASDNNNHLELRTKEQAALDDPQFAALVDFCHVLMNSNEFVYVD